MMFRELRSIRPIDLANFLRFSDWTQVKEAMEDDLYVLNSPDDSRQIVFPATPSAPDYYDAVSIAINKLGVILDENAESLIPQIRNSRSDVLHVRVMTKKGHVSIPFEAAAQMVGGIEKYLRTSAATVVNPRRFHPRLGFIEASRLLETAQLEQSAPGSYIFNVACPVDALDDDFGLFSASEDGSFVRRVFSTAYSAASKVIRSIETDSVDELIKQSLNDERPLISSNLCEALVAMSDPAGQATSINISWSGAIPKEKTKPIKLLNEFSGDLSRISRTLREEIPEAEETFIGTVERLDGDIGPDDRRSGAVILSVLDRETGDSIRVRVSLNSDQYALADKVHMTPGAFVRIKGRLLPGRQPRTLDSLSLFDQT